MKIVSTAQMREMDRQTIEEFHVPGILLMENAASKVIEVLHERFGPLKDKVISIICGKGNNGGDGMAIARQLSERFNACVKVYLLADASVFRGDAAITYAMAKAFGINFQPALEEKFLDSEIIIDALFGTGIKGPVTGDAAKIIKVMNESGKQIVSVDVPSGLDSDSGNAPGAVVNASITVTFALSKFGLLEFPGASYAGEVIVADIGIPRAVMNAPVIHTYATDVNDLAQWLPARINGRDANKGSYGHVFIFAGSADVVGAPVMVAEAATRTGAGLVTLVIPEDLKQSVMSRVSPVVMTVGVPQTEVGSFGIKSLERALSLVTNAAAVAIGPGMSLCDEVAQFVRAFVQRCPVPLVIDADALTLLARESDHGESIIKNRKECTIMTPHPAEMGRLLGIDTKDIQEDRRRSVTLAAKKFGCVVILKGARTLIADANGTIYLNSTGNPGMATGGTGDVLTGVIAALLAQKLEPLHAAAAGAYIHGLAGDLTETENGGAIGMIATDIIERLPQAIALHQTQS